MAAKRGLGRGLETILGDEKPSRPEAEGGRKGVMLVPLGDIIPDPNQPRKHFDDDAIEGLAASIRARGLLQPVLVRDAGDEAPGHRYILIAGERRWRAAAKAGLHDLPALVRQSDPGETAELALIENVQREDLNPIEEADAYAHLRDAFGKKAAEIADAVGKSRSHVSNMLRLTTLDSDLRVMVVEGALSMGHARALLSAKDPASLAQRIVKDGLSVRQTEALAAGRPGKTTDTQDPVKAKGAGGDAAGEAKTATGGNPKDADTRSLERDLEAALGLSVAIEHSRRGGTVTLAYDSLDQLDDICRRLIGTSF